jgi:hypothetical protein
MRCARAAAALHDHSSKRSYELIAVYVYATLCNVCPSSRNAAPETNSLRVVLERYVELHYGKALAEVHMLLMQLADRWYAEHSPRLAALLALGHRLHAASGAAPPFATDTAAFQPPFTMGACDQSGS